MTSLNIHDEYYLHELTSDLLGLWDQEKEVFTHENMPDVIETMHKLQEYLLVVSMTLDEELNSLDILENAEGLISDDY